MWKICTKCKKHKALWAFHKDSRLLFNSRSQCKQCISEKNKGQWQDPKYRAQQTQYRKNNKEHYREWMSNNYKSNRKYYRKRNKLNYENNREYYLTSSKKLRTGKALADSYYVNKLTIEESPRPAKDKLHIEVKCRYCGKYFIPTYQQLASRVRALNSIEYGSGEHNIYCSTLCKHTCPLFNWHEHYGSRTPTIEVPKDLRQIVFKRDKYICRKCGKRHVSLHCHHIIPKVYEPLLAADPDNCITLCKECHKKVHQQPGCTSGDLRKFSVNNCEA